MALYRQDKCAYRLHRQPGGDGEKQTTGVKVHVKNHDAKRKQDLYQIKPSITITPTTKHNAVTKTPPSAQKLRPWTAYSQSSSSRSPHGANKVSSSLRPKTSDSGAASSTRAQEPKHQNVKRNAKRKDNVIPGRSYLGRTTKNRPPVTERTASPAAPTLPRLDLPVIRVNNYLGDEVTDVLVVDGAAGDIATEEKGGVSSLVNLIQPWSLGESITDEPYPPTEPGKTEDDAAVSDTSSVISEDTSLPQEEEEEAKEAEPREDDEGEEEEEEEEEDVGPAEGQTLESWLAGGGYNSDDYDTDLEEDFPPEPEPPVDPTAAYTYGELCKKQGIVPVSYLIRNMGEGNLRMRHHYLGGVGTKPLAKAMKDNTVCEEIDLSDNYMEGDGAAALAGMLKDNMFVVNLNISHNFIKSEGAAAFSEMLEANTTLKTLSLKGNQLSDWDAKKIAEAMKNNMSLVCLDLSNNCFGERAGVHLAMGIASNIGLNDLDLSWNGLREKGAVAVAKAIGKNSTLEIFDISWNGFAHNGTMALAQSIRINKTLKVLDVSNNRIDTEAAKKLGLALGRNKSLETILLGMNPIGEEGVEAILKGVDANKSLRLVGLEDISVSPRLQQKIKEITTERDVMIMYSSGSPQQSKMNQTILAVFDRFISENADRMEDLFNQMDKDKTGCITLEEFKYGLKDFGLRLTSKQVDLLLDILDADRSGTIEFEELMAGTDMVEQEKQKQARAEKEAHLFTEGLVLQQPGKTDEVEPTKQN